MKYKNKIPTFFYIGFISFISLSSMAYVSCSEHHQKHIKTDLPSNADSNIISASGLKKIADLNVKVKETSGLALIGDILLTHNDKGRSNDLMLINPENGNILQTITAANFQNNDWEDIAKNEEFLFIGDIGNNEGERKNLAIYMAPLSEINKNNTSIKATGTINFYYPEQKEFDVTKKHNYDCEAMLCFQNQIYLFTKNRLDDKTDLYVLPAKSGNYAAKYIGSFEVGGRITGADMSTDGKKIALIGYDKKADCFIWTFEGFTGDNFFTGNSKKYTLGPYAQVGQMEGIAFKDNSSLFISSEEIAHVNARLYLFKLD
jgi:hypothetical protein